MSIATNGLAMHSNFNDLKTKTMSKEEILNQYESFHYTEDGCDEQHYYRDNVLMAMEEYHQAKLKLLGIGVVSLDEQGEAQLKAQEDAYNNGYEDAMRDQNESGIKI